MGRIPGEGRVELESDGSWVLCQQRASGEVKAHGASRTLLPVPSAYRSPEARNVPGDKIRGGQPASSRLLPVPRAGGLAPRASKG